MGNDTYTSREQLGAFQRANRQLQNHRAMIKFSDGSHEELEAAVAMLRDGTRDMLEAELMIWYLEEQLEDSATAYQGIIESFIAQLVLLRDKYCGGFQYTFTPTTLGISSFQITDQGGGDALVLDNEIGSTSMILQYIVSAGDKLTFLGSNIIADGEYVVVSVSSLGAIVTFTGTNTGQDISGRITLTEIA